MAHGQVLPSLKYLPAKDKRRGLSSDTASELSLVSFSAQPFLTAELFLQQPYTVLCQSGPQTGQLDPWDEETGVSANRAC